MSQPNGISVRATPSLTPHPALERHRDADSARAVAQLFTVGGSAVSMVAGAMSGGAGPVAGLVGGLGGSGALGGDITKLQELLSLQMRVQTQMQEFSMQSNIARTRHESRMAAIRNMRA